MGTQLVSPKSGGNQTGDGGGDKREGGETGGKQTFQQKIKSYLQDRFDTGSLEKLETSTYNKVEKVIYGGCFSTERCFTYFCMSFCHCFLIT